MTLVPDHPKSSKNGTVSIVDRSGRLLAVVQIGTRLGLSVRLAERCTNGSARAMEYLARELACREPRVTSDGLITVNGSGARFSERVPLGALLAELFRDDFSLRIESETGGQGLA
jgi:hypothetical protein